MSAQVTSRAEAVRIYQDLLDVLSDAIVTGDLHAVRDRVKLPFVRRTLNSQVIIETEDDLDRGTIGVAQALVAKGINQFIRLTADADFLGPNYIQGHHVTHLLSNANRVLPSYATRAVLQRVDGVWKMAESESNLQNTEWPLKRFEVPDDTDTVARFPVDPDDIRCTSAEPLALYQQFLDELTVANNARDFDAYCALCSYPYTSHHDASDIVMDSPDDTRRFFETVSQLMQSRCADRLERRADRAEFISGNLICGYHSSRMYRRGLVVLGPIQSRMILERQGTRWLLKSVTNSVSNTTYPYSDPIAAQTLVTIREIQERQRQ